MIKKIAGALCCVLIMLVIFTGCGENTNTEIVGKWVPTTATLNGETVKYSELGIDESQFCFVFESNGKCTATLAGISGNGTYNYHNTSVDVEINNDTKKLDYDGSTLTLNLDYDGNSTSIAFIKEK